MKNEKLRQKLHLLMERNKLWRLQSIYDKSKEQNKLLQGVRYLKNRHRYGAFETLFKEPRFDWGFFFFFFFFFFWLYFILPGWIQNDLITYLVYFTTVLKEQTHDFTK